MGDDGAEVATRDVVEYGVAKLAFYMDLAAAYWRWGISPGVAGAGGDVGWVVFVAPLAVLGFDLGFGADVGDVAGRMIGVAEAGAVDGVELLEGNGVVGGGGGLLAHNTTMSGPPGSRVCL